MIEAWAVVETGRFAGSKFQAIRRLYTSERQAKGYVTWVKNHENPDADLRIVHLLEGAVPEIEDRR
ncbi:hypothetical protein [Brevibacterium moorei]|uniref:hypothetical protein n=1 Tax=Brevibacterium moorei TaxID=2968457 RepID=UPI00211BAF3F|nr:hypothetical protein [Brevibacterium sp. 68QC2CO]MCQ9385154.1 hypothetical protein [Brevibacterium sp. 68QC2CO]